MNMKDLIDLVRAGLKPGEIKEMIELEKQARDINIDEDTESQSNNEAETDNTSETDNESTSQQDDTVTEELKVAQAEIAKLKTQLTTIQNENKNKDISNQQSKTIDEQIVDIFNQML